MNILNGAPWPEGNKCCGEKSFKGTTPKLSQFSYANLIMLNCPLSFMFLLPSR